MTVAGVVTVTVIADARCVYVFANVSHYRSAKHHHYQNCSQINFDRQSAYLFAFRFFLTITHSFSRIRFENAACVDVSWFQLMNHDLLDSICTSREFIFILFLSFLLQFEWMCCCRQRFFSLASNANYFHFDFLNHSEQSDQFSLERNLSIFAFNK